MTDKIVKTFNFGENLNILSYLYQCCELNKKNQSVAYKLLRVILEKPPSLMTLFVELLVHPRNENTYVHAYIYILPLNFNAVFRCVCEKPTLL